MKTKTEFKPAWWLPGPHLQTLWPTICRKRLNSINLERERFELPDGDFLDLDWAGNQDSKSPIVLILHGLEGSIDSPYALGMLKALIENEWRGVFMHFRGCSGEPNRLSKSYHSGETKDLAAVVNYLARKYPSAPIAVIGFSLGGNVLLKWLGETGKDNPLRVATAVSVPFELDKAAIRMQSGFSRLYQWHLLKCLRTRLSRKFQREWGSNELDLKALSKAKTLWEFDEKITAPLHGFSCAKEYYSRSSSRQYLAHICVPTLLVHSVDDPFMTTDLIPEPEELPEQVHLEVTPGGGHVGFVTGRFPWRSEYWLERRVPDFLKGYF